MIDLPQNSYQGLQQSSSQNDNQDQGNYSSQSSEMDENILKELIEVEETLHKFEMETLRGMKIQIDLKNKTRKYIEIAKGSPKLCNELGIREILGRLRGRFTKVGRLTNKTSEEVMRDMFYFHMSMIDLFTDRADEWDMDESLVKPILDACVELVQDLTYSAKEGFTAKNVKSQYSRNENVATTSESQAARSFLGFRLRK